MADVRIGLVGCGGIGAVHARAWSRIEGARLAAACDADLARAEATEAPAFHAIEEMLDADVVDAVDLCTPPHLHLPLGLAVIERGLPLLCEKPLARTPSEARELYQAAEARATLLMTAFCHRFHPPVEAVAARIRAGELGRVLMFRNRFGALFAGVEERWFSNPEISGGGALMDTSVHRVDLFRHLVGEVAAAGSAVHTFHPGIRGVEDSGVLLLRSEEGALGVIEASWMTPNSANVVELYGEKGAAVIDYDTGETRMRLAGEEAWTVLDTGAGDRFEAELRHFAAVVRGEEEPRVTGQDGLRAVEVIYQGLAACLA